MKNTIKLAIVLVAFISFTACDDLTDVDFPTSLNQNIPVHISSTGEGEDTFSESIQFSIDNKDTHDYLKLFKTVEITKFTFKIINFQGDDSGEIDAEFFVDSTSLINVKTNVKTAADNSTIYEITNVQQLNAISKVLKNGQNVTAKIQGTVNSMYDDMDFQVAITIEVKIVASII
jgi:hypothetical protein